MRIAITPQLDPDPNAVAAAIINITAGKIDMGIVSPNVETI
jgi:hypothetical protein